MQIGVDSQRAVENKRVFVVDSDDVTGMALQFMLADEMETHVLLSVSDAVTKGAGFPPHLVLLSTSVIAAEGADAVTRLKDALGGVRMLIVCEDPEDALVKEALALGAESTLLRPLKLEKVRSKVDAQIGRRATLTIPVVKA